MLPRRIWPRIPLPSGPARSGSFSAPAARMTGVASRKANRAASSRDRPRVRPAIMVTPSRLVPPGGGAGGGVAARAHQLGVLPLTGASRVGVQRGAAAEALPGDQDDAVEGQEGGGVTRLAEEDPAFVLERQPGQGARDG